MIGSTLYFLIIEPIQFLLRSALEFAYGITGSHGVSIIILGLFFNILLTPAYHAAELVQAKEWRIKQKMEPKLKEFNDVFNGQEKYWFIQTLYRQHSYHPLMALRSLMPLAIQIPFFIAAFTMLSDYQPINGKNFASISDLGEPDGLLGDLNFLPLLMTIFNFISVYLYCRNASFVEKTQGYLIGLIFLALLYTANSGLVLYWTTNNLFSIFKSLLYAQLFRSPKVTNS